MRDLFVIRNGGWFGVMVLLEGDQHRLVVYSCLVRCQNYIARYNIRMKGLVCTRGAIGSWRCIDTAVRKRIAMEYTVDGNH